MADNSQVNELISPPDVDERHWGDWFSVSQDSPLVEYLSNKLWPHKEKPLSWEGARLSGAACLYREVSTKWTVFAKHYKVKTGEKALKYSEREFKSTVEARSAGLAIGNIQAVKPLGCFRGVLFLEYSDGLTLEDAIAVRRSRPGVLIKNLEYTAKLLATLHSNSIQHELSGNFTDSIHNIHGIIDNLYKYGVLKEEPLIYDGLITVVERWKEKEFMKNFTPTFIHGDATTSNFIFPWSGGIIAVDWERFYRGDPAGDTGRLVAEISHSITRHGGTQEEAIPCVRCFEDTYCRALPEGWNKDELRKRLPFYQALSTLRIARNGWLPRLERMTLVTRAALLLAL